MNFLGLDINLESHFSDHELTAPVERPNPINQQGFHISEDLDYPDVKEAELMEQFLAHFHSENDLDLLAEPDDLMMEEDDWGLDVPQDEILLEHISVKANRLATKMENFVKEMKRAGLDVTDYKPMSPQRKNKIVFQRVLFRMNDGQTISAVFQITGTTGTTITPDATMTTFQFKVNRKDITRFLYPTSKKRLSMKGLAKALGAYVKANTDNFMAKQAELKNLDRELEEQEQRSKSFHDLIQKAQGRETEVKTEIDDLNAQIETLESRLEEVQQSIEALQRTPTTPAEGEDRSAVPEDGDSVPAGDGGDSTNVESDVETTGSEENLPPNVEEISTDEVLAMNKAAFKIKGTQAEVAAAREAEDYETRVQALEAEGISRSDAQGIVDAEMLNGTDATTSEVDTSALEAQVDAILQSDDIDEVADFVEANLKNLEDSGRTDLVQMLKDHLIDLSMRDD